MGQITSFFFLFLKGGCICFTGFLNGISLLPFSKLYPWSFFLDYIPFFLFFRVITDLKMLSCLNYLLGWQKENFVQEIYMHIFLFFPFSVGGNKCLSFKILLTDLTLDCAWCNFVFLLTSFLCLAQEYISGREFKFSYMYCYSKIYIKSPCRILYTFYVLHKHCHKYNYYIAIMLI